MLKSPRLDFMNMAFKDDFIQIVNIEKLQTNLEITSKELKKGLDNFRASLRQKFNFSESESFFQSIDGELRLNASIFKLKDKIE